MIKILAHIAGPSGSGKTTLGKLIKKKYNDIIIKDLDDFYIILKNNNKLINIDNIQKLINKFIKINKNKKIILTGSNSISTKNDFSDSIYYDINAKYKYFINIDVNIVLKRRFKRHIQYMIDNVDKYFNKGLKKGKIEIDFELWKKKIEQPYNSNFYHKNNYIFLNNKEIFNSINKILNN